MRTRSARALLPALTLAICGALLPVAPATATDWRARVAASAAQPVVSRPVPLKHVLVAELDAAVDQAALDALRQDLATRFVDDSRPRDAAAADAVFAHDRTLLVALQANLNQGTHPDLVAPTIRLMQAAEGTALALVKDLSTVARYTGGRADATSLDQAQRLLGQAERAWQAGQPVAAVVHWQQAADRSFDVLARHGLAFDELADADGDGVPDLMELAFGADPFSADGDGDGLHDSFEILKAPGAHDPGRRDTDHDQIPDGIEDEDDDGLSARSEQAVGTDALAPDTDGDSLSDGDEVAGGTDPLMPDPSGAEVTTSTLREDGVVVRLTGQGNLAGRLEVNPVPGSALRGAPGQVTEPIEVHLPDAATARLESAQLTLQFDQDAAGGNAEALRIFTFDEELQFWVPAGDRQVVDAAAGTVTTTVPHFSIFAIFDVPNWKATFTGLGGTCDPRGGTGETAFVDVAFVLDSSGSMLTNDRYGLRKTASIQFVNAMLPQDRGAVIDFDSWAKILQPLTSDKDALRAAINRINSSGGTNIGAGVSAGLTALRVNTDGTRVQLMILLTDGVGAYNHSLTEQAAAAGVTIYTVGLGTGVDPTLLRSIAAGTGGTYYSVAEAADLPEVFREIEEDTGDDGTDTDADGLTDCQEEKGIADDTGRVHTSDPRLEDTDRDGLLDGQEISGDLSDLALLLLGPLATDADIRTVVSDPRDEDSDDDGLNDPEELDLGTRARSAHSDTDSLEDAAEADESGTDPLGADTDGDGRHDDWELANEAAGYDPLVFDREVSKWSYAGDFVLGGTCPAGWEFCEKESVAWLAGNLAGGFLVYKDVLDIIGGITTLDVVSTGLSAASLIPIGGDAASVVNKGVRFVKRVGDSSVDGLAYLLRSDLLPLSAKMDLLKQVDGVAVGRLQDHGLAEEAIVALVRRRVDFRVVARALENAAGVRRSPELYRLEKQAENYLRSADPGALPRQIGFAPASATAGSTRGYRYPDVYNPTTQVAVEVKAGHWKALDYVKDQIRKDVALRADPNSPIRRVEWHFFPRTNGTFGPSDELRELLMANQIPYVIHLP